MRVGFGLREVCPGDLISCEKHRFQYFNVPGGGKNLDYVIEYTFLILL